MLYYYFFVTLLKIITDHTLLLDTGKLPEQPLLLNEHKRDH